MTWPRGRGLFKPDGGCRRIFGHGIALSICAALCRISLRGNLSRALAVAPRVLVTGGNKGIGKALCQQLVVDHGWHVLLGARDETRGAEAVRSILEAAPQCDGLIEHIRLDVSSDASVATAAELVEARFGVEPAPLRGIVNNAGIGFGRSMVETLEVNTYGPRRVCNAFMHLLCQGDGRIVNIASASGPTFVAGCYKPHIRKTLVDPAVTWEQIEAIIEEVRDNPHLQPYGLSKACLNAYTVVLARERPDLRINACTPGFIATDLTVGLGATTPPEAGTKAPLFCLMGDVEGSGRYYGSDAVRSPLDKYRAPGDPPYEGP